MSGRCYIACCVSRGIRKIDELTALLEKAGGDPRRLDALKRTQRFKRSWIDLAEALVKIRREEAYTQWGFDDFYAYCSQELQLRRATVDKLTVSYSTIHQHAPQVLNWDGVAKTIPSYQAVDYFSKAVDADPGTGKRAERHGEAVKELEQAVFDEGQPLAELRKRFDPVLHPKPRGAAKLELVRRASAAARKLAEVLPDVDGLSEKRVQQVERALGALRQDLDELEAPLKDMVASGRKRAKPPRLKAVD